MGSIENIYEAITADGFCERTLQLIDEQVNDIQNGTEDFPRFNLSEHAGLSKGGAPLIGASIVACYATASLRAGCNAEGCQGSFRDNWDGQGVNYISDRMALEDMHPANVFIDEVSGKPICIDCIVKFV